MQQEFLSPLHTGGDNSAAVRYALVLIFKIQCYTSISNVKFLWNVGVISTHYPVSKMIQQIYYSQILCRKTNLIPITPPTCRFWKRLDNAVFLIFRYWKTQKNIVKWIMLRTNVSDITHLCAGLDFKSSVGLRRTAETLFLW